MTFQRNDQQLSLLEDGVQLAISLQYDNLTELQILVSIHMMLYEAFRYQFIINKSISWSVQYDLIFRLYLESL